MQALKSSGLLEQTRSIDWRAAVDEEILLCHNEGYLESAKKDVQAGRSMLRTGDTPLSSDTMEVSLETVGGVLNVVDAAVGGEVQNAMCVIRPPGHHACRGAGMGFCVFNNIALAARYAQRAHGLERVLIADWDVHHGNGTQDIFYDDPSVLFFSTHQYPWYPGTGARNEEGSGAAKGTTRNCPFPAGSGSREIVGAFEKELLPLADSFRPDLVLISAGFDSRHGDPLGEFLLTDEDFAELTLLLGDIARRHAQGRMISMLEGGYNLSGLAAAVGAHAHALAELAAPNGKPS
jgi:acetoin utilization deacetylase AcuC-like enzyme